MGEARLHVTETLGPAREIRLLGDRAHYLRHVLRLREGDALRLFNAEDGEWRAELRRTARHEVELLVGTCLRHPADEPGPTLVFAPIRRNRLDWLVEKAVELGAARLVPVLTRRTVVKPESSTRLEAIAREAAEQCERLTVPTIEPPRPLTDWLAARKVGEPFLVALERDPDAHPLATALAPGRPPIFLVGPEGGFALEERALLLAAPAVRPVSLGPRILRAETAALYGLACWQAVQQGGRPAR